MNGVRYGLAAALVVAIGCARHPSPDTNVTDVRDARTLLEALRARSEPAGAYEARLFLVFEGGYLNEDRLKINGEMLAAWPDHLRMIGAYGAFRKVFDLSVDADRFQVYDNRANVAYFGSASSWEASEELGLALRPVDLFRVLRLGGEGPLMGARIEAVDTGGDSLRVAFRAGDDRRWHAVYEPERLRLVRMWRESPDGADLDVRYERYTERDGRDVPHRVAVTRPRRGERVEIEVRSIRFKSDVPRSAFLHVPPADADTVHLPAGKPLAAPRVKG